LYQTGGAKVLDRPNGPLLADEVVGSWPAEDRVSLVFEQGVEVLGLGALGGSDGTFDNKLLPTVAMDRSGRFVVGLAPNAIISAEDVVDKNAKMTVHSTRTPTGDAYIGAHVGITPDGKRMAIGWPHGRILVRAVPPVAGQGVTADSSTVIAPLYDGDRVIRILLKARSTLMKVDVDGEVVKSSRDVPAGSVNIGLSQPLRAGQAVQLITDSDSTSASAIVRGGLMTFGTPPDRPCAKFYPTGGGTEISISFGSETSTCQADLPISVRSGYRVTISAISFERPAGRPYNLFVGAAFNHSTLSAQTIVNVPSTFKLPAGAQGRNLAGIQDSPEFVTVKFDQPIVSPCSPNTLSIAVSMAPVPPASSLAVGPLFHWSANDAAQFQYQPCTAASKQ
jgi:hypothetical protein